MDTFSNKHPRRVSRVSRAAEQLSRGDPLPLDFHASLLSDGIDVDALEDQVTTRRRTSKYLSKDTE